MMIRKSEIERRERLAALEARYEEMEKRLARVEERTERPWTRVAELCSHLAKAVEILQDRRERSRDPKPGSSVAAEAAEESHSQDP